MAYNNNLHINFQQTLSKVENNVKHFCTFAYKEKSWAKRLSSARPFSFHNFNNQFIVFLSFYFVCARIACTFRLFLMRFYVPPSQQWCMHFVYTTCDKYFFQLFDNNDKCREKACKLNDAIATFCSITIVSLSSTENNYDSRKLHNISFRIEIVLWVEWINCIEYTLFAWDILTCWNCSFFRNCCQSVGLWERCLSICEQ